jgi:hypothetical protein
MTLRHTSNITPSVYENNAPYHGILEILAGFGRGMQKRWMRETVPWTDIESHSYATILVEDASSNTTWVDMEDAHVSCSAPKLALWEDASAAVPRSR